MRKMIQPFEAWPEPGLNKSQEEEGMKTHFEEKAEYELRAFALALFMFAGGAAIGFLLGVGIYRWGW